MYGSNKIKKAIDSYLQISFVRTGFTESENVEQVFEGKILINSISYFKDRNHTGD